MNLRAVWTQIVLQEPAKQLTNGATALLYGA
jgi:hypothetical protein